MTPLARPREVPGAASPLTRTVLTGPARQATVVASFPSALYLLAGGHHEVLPVLASDALMLPTGTRLSAPGREVSWGVGPGDQVTIGDSRIRLPSWQVNVVREWRPAHVRAVWTLLESRSLSSWADQLCRRASAPALVDQADAVCRVARDGDEAGVRDRVRGLLGAGQGLTPSGDDALCAVLLVLNGIGEAEPIALLSNAVREQWTGTTSLSASLLEAAAGGYAVPQLVALVDGVLGGNLDAVRQALTSTLAIGHQSGADLVAGLAGSLRALAGAPSGTAPTLSPTVKEPETMSKRCSDISFIPRRRPVSGAHPGGLKSLTDPNALSSLNDPGPRKRGNP
ncbi:MAG: DUF2877 domain-containing protein [Actinomycetota bacterium]